MSDTDSFIEEVSDEVRRDKLFAFFKKYAWVFIAVVILIVGGTAVSGYLKSQKQSEAQAMGEALLSAQNNRSASEFAEIAAGESPAAILAKFNQSAMLAMEGQAEAAAAILDEISSDGDVLPLYRELALLKTVMINGKNMSSADLNDALASLTSEGAPFRLLAIEQRAIVSLRNGDKDAALADLAEILNDSDTTQDLRSRVQELTVALGGEISAPQFGG